MKQTILLKARWLLCGLLAVFLTTNAWAEEQVYKTALFGSSYNSGGVSVYTTTWTATNDGFTVSLSNFNNNNNGWAYVKCGRKNNASVGTIITDAAIDKAVTKVVVTIDAITAAKVNSIKLYRSTNKTDWTEESSFTAATGAQEVTIASANQAANLYYKVEFDCASGSSNGLVTVSKVEYYAEVGGGGDEPAVTLSSISVSGDLSDKTYENTERIDLTGLTVTGTYSDASTNNVTANATWEVRTDGTSESFTPSTYVLTAGQTSVQVRAIVGEVSSEWVEITGLTVTEHVVTPDEYTINLNNDFYGVTIGNNAEEQSATQNDITVVSGCASDASTKTNYQSGHIRYYDKSYLNLSVPAGYTITSIEFTADGTWNGGITASAGSYDSESKTWTGNSQNVDFSFTAQNRISTVTVTFAEVGSCSAPTITTQPAGAIYSLNDAATALSVEAEACDKISGTLSYQWYSNTTESNEGGVAITGEEAASFTPATTAEGVVYYYCVVSQGEASVASEAVAVTVEGPEVGVSFEQELSAYTDWTFSNIVSQQTTQITAHGKTHYGTTGGKTTASMVTAAKIAGPDELTFYVSKTSGNNTSTTWYVRVSSDNSTWTTVTSQSAATMSQGQWIEVSADLSAYTNVYVGIFYEGGTSTAVRAIDDVILTTRSLVASAITYNDAPDHGMVSIEKDDIELASGTTVNEGDVLDVFLAGDDGYVGTVAVTDTESGEDITTEVYNAETGKLTMPAYPITVTATFVVGVETPVFDLADGIYADAQLVVLTTSTTGATIYYTMTTDGSTPADPTNASTLYDANEGIELNARGTYKIKAVAYKNENYSTIAAAEYTLNIPYVFATVADMVNYLETNSLTELDNVVVTGVVSKIVTAYSSQHGNVTFDISDDGQTTGNQMRGYRTTGTNADVVAVGDKVTLSGDYTLYNDVNNNTLIPELKVGNTITAYTAKVLSSVTVGGNATKTVYSANETFDFGGLTATAHYSNTGYSALIDNAEITWATNLSENKVTESATVQVTATYGGISSATYNVAVTVSTKDLSSIALGQNAYTVYKGAALPKPAVTATYTEGEPADVSAEAVYDTESAYDAATADVYTITVSYTFGTTTKTATYQVTVQEYANADDAPYTVAQALDIIVNAIGNVESADEIVVTGTVSEDNINNNKNRYKISDGTNELLVYGGKGFNNATFTNANYPQVGDVVVVKGKVIHFQGNTPEFASGKSRLLSQIRPVMLSVDNVTAFEVGTADMEEGDLTIDRKGSDGEITFASEDETIVSIVDNKLHAVAPGTTTITANMAATSNENALNYAATSTTFQVKVIAAQTRYAVTFAANGGEGTAPTMDDQLEDASFNLPANTFTKDGYKFAGWNDGTATYAAGAEYTMPAEAVTFTAQWTEIPYYAGVYTSNVSFGWTGTSGESNSKVVINSTEYDAQKVGSKSNDGSVVVTVPYGTHTLHFHALAWNGKSVTIEASEVTNMSVSSFALTADGGFSGNTIYNLQNDPTDQYFVMTFDATTEVETTITFSKASGDDNRFMLYGINQEGGVERELDHIEISGNAEVINYEDGDIFNPQGLIVTAVYNVGPSENVTNDVTWSFNPSILTEGTTSVTATATYGEQTDDINVLVTVTASTHAYTTREIVFVVKSGDDYFAMGQDNTGSYLNGVGIEMFNGKMLNVAVADRAAITWILREYPNGETAIMTQNGKFLNGADSGTNLTLSDEEILWIWDATYGCYQLASGTQSARTFLYQAGTVNKFRFYNKTNIDATGYSSAPILATEYVDGTVETLREGLEAGKLGTLCWNKKLVEVEGAVLYDPEYPAVGQGGVGFIETTSMEAGKPFVFQASGEKIRALVTGEATLTPGTNNGLVGVFEQTGVDGDYIVYQNRIHRAFNSTVTANRAYLVMDNIVDQRGVNGNAPARRRLVIGQPSQTPTGDEQVNAELKAEKVVIDGHIYIRRGEKMYDLNGQQVR